MDLDEGPFGAIKPKVALAIRKLTGITLGEPDFLPAAFDDYYDIARDEYARLHRYDPSWRDGLTLLTYVSTFFHELRHVHDLMTSKYGQELVFRHLNLYQNGFVILNALWAWQSENPAGTIPLPITH